MTSSLASRSAALLLLGVALAAPAGAVPVDLSDPTLRSIWIELESTPCDPVAGTEDQCRVTASDPGAVFATVLSGSFEIVGGEAIVTIAAADWEQVLFSQQGVGSTAPDVAGIVPGTSSDAVLRFDAVTGMPTGWDWSAILHFSILGFWFDIPLAGAIAASPNELFFTNYLGTDLALNCAEGGAPAPGPFQCLWYTQSHLPYDPATGTITALGAVANGIVRPAWAPADWRLSEGSGPPPAGVPEPGAWALLASGVVGLARFGRERGRR